MYIQKDDAIAPKIQFQEMIKFGDIEDLIKLDNTCREVSVPFQN